MTPTPTPDAPERSRISRAYSTWLETESAKWVEAGAIDAAARAKILGAYEVESAERHGMLALMLLGALMFGIGVLLLIGYNWALIPVNAKIAIIMSSVALAYGASAFALSRHHPVAGDTLAFVGVMLFGNAIWLIAQVLHIEGNFSDAFFWWSLGALATAWLVESKPSGIGAAVLLGMWAIAAGFSLERPVIAFLAMWLATVAAAYRLRSTVMLKVAAVGAVAWALVASERLEPSAVSFGLAALACCAFYAIGSWHPASSRMKAAWQSTGVAMLVLLFIPLLIVDFHDDTPAEIVAWSRLIAWLPLLAIAISPVVQWLGLRPVDASGPRPHLADIAIAITAATVAVWMILIVAGWAGGSGWGRTATVAFSALALLLSVALIRKALRTDTASNLAFGVFFALAFLLVRWASLIDSMLWSGLMLLVASGGFFGIARLWRGRAQRQVAAESAS